MTSTHIGDARRRARRFHPQIPLDAERRQHQIAERVAEARASTASASKPYPILL